MTPRPIEIPLAPERYKLQFTISGETHAKLRRLQALGRHVIRSGDPSEIFDRALTLLLQDLERRRCAAVTSPRTTKKTVDGGSRHIPASVKREVWRRDGGRCAYIGRDGRCTERGFLGACPSHGTGRPPGSGGVPASAALPLLAKGPPCRRRGARNATHAMPRTGSQYHYVQPYAAGGVATAVNIELRCRAHNAYEASLFFGPEPDPAVEHPTT